MKGITRVTGVILKEIREVVRQPSLMLVLILGPFLILLLFGLGHASIQPPLKTIMVVPADVQLPVPPEEYPRLFGPSIELVGTVDDPAQAIEQMKEGDVDIVVIIPRDLYQRLAAGDQASVSVIYDEIDPVMTNYIRFIAAAQISDMNRHILEAGIKQTTGPEGQLGRFSTEVEAELDALEQDVAAGDTASAVQRVARMDAAAATAEARLEAVRQFIGAEPRGAAAERLTATRDALAKFRADLAVLRRDLVAGSPNVPQDIAQLRNDADTVSQTTADLGEVPARVIAAPLVSETENLAPVQPDFVAFYAPSVLALLLQHIAVTFGALSIVRERIYGAIELFRVAPIGALQILTGKYVAYLLLCLVVTAALTFLVVAQLRVPFVGSYDFFAAAIVGLILASLGIGFCISLVSSSERQAVQLAMLTLIASVFFSGFFIPLESFRWPVRAVAYLLPVTYGISTLQDVMLRGRGGDYLFLGALAAAALVLFSAAVRMMRRELGQV